MEAPDPYPNKRFRPQSPPSSPSRTAKGKEKMGDPFDGVAAECGICLSGGERSVRGRIDCCDHFFCFVCIMEWAKIESLCPMCKRRFRSIRRPLTRGLFPSERLVQIPVRDQVYHPLGNESTGIFDPYENVVCSICHGNNDEHLLLLCDLCESAAHTYCVGLGATVPEGDWYCLDCTISRDEHSKAQSDGDCCNQNSHRNLVVDGMSEQPLPISEIVSDEIASPSSQNFSTHCVVEKKSNNCRPPSTNTPQKKSQASMLRTEQSSPLGITSEPSVSIFEIVSEGTDFEAYRGLRNVREQAIRERFSSRRESQDSELRREQTSSSSNPIGGSVSSIPAAVDSGPRTLRRCRNLHGRIRTLRENWNALRAGSLAFSSSSPNGVDTVNDRKQKGSRSRSEPSRMLAATSIKVEQVSLDTTNYMEKHTRISTPDVDKAWKMLEIAKSVQRKQRGSASDLSVKSYNMDGLSRREENIQSSCSISRANTVNNVSDDSRCVPLKTLVNKPKSQDLEKQQSDAYIMEDKQQMYRVTSNTVFSSHAELTSNPHFRFTSKDVKGQAPHRPVHKLPMSVDKRDPCSSVCSISEPFINPTNFSRCEVDPQKRNHGTFVNTDNHSIRGDIEDNRDEGQIQLLDKAQLGDEISTKINDIARSGAKTEVQTLVKINLKLLCKDQHLGADRFKEVARASTHTVLAACGLEHSKSSARSFPRSVCVHDIQIQNLRRSSLMPDSCRDCFYTFIKDVVEAVLSETHSKPSQLLMK